MGRPVFVSHAVKDKALADALVDLLVTGLGVSLDAIFCSSLEGIGIPQGKNFVAFIKGQLESPKVVILLLTPHYFDSVFCVCELGASWILTHEAFPLLVPPLEYADAKAVLVGVQAGKINDKATLSDLKDVVCRALNLKDASTARWEAKRDNFLEALPEILAKAGTPARVDAAKLADAEGRYAQAIAELKQEYKRGEEKDRLIADLRKCKDATEVADVIAAHSGEWEQFTAAAQRARGSLGKLPTVVQEALFHHFSDTAFSPDRYLYKDKWEDIDAAVRSDFLVVRDGNVEVNEDDPLVSAAMESLHPLREFLRGASEDFQRDYAEKHQHNPKFTSQRFWNQNL